MRVCKSMHKFVWQHRWYDAVHDAMGLCIVQGIYVRTDIRPMGHLLFAISRENAISNHRRVTIDWIVLNITACNAFFLQICFSSNFSDICVRTINISPFFTLHSFHRRCNEKKNHNNNFYCEFICIYPPITKCNCPHTHTRHTQLLWW